MSNSANDQVAPESPLSHSLANSGRRKFLKTTSAVAATGLVGANLLKGAEGGDTIRVGLIGCGGRGTGAAEQALKADPNCVLYAVGDAFSTQIDKSLKNLSNQFSNAPERIDVPTERRFVGMDAFREVIASDVDVVLLTTPPGFRPQHFEAAIAAGKHAFCEKPMAVDAAGVRSVMKTVEEAKRKNLGVLAGFCWRYSPSRREAFSKLHDGEIGDVVGIYSTYYVGPVKPHPSDGARPDGMGDVEWQMRNWYNYSWISGDSLPEQACHSVDKMSWALGDADPIACIATGGRQVPSKGGNIFDHFHIAYEYADNVWAHLGSRQQRGCSNENHDYIRGTLGALIIGRGGIRIDGENAWRYRGKGEANMYQVEHNEFFASLREGKPINDGDWMARSTMLAVMGRMAAYTGKRITWQEALDSPEDLAPDDLTFDSEFDPGGVPIPGQA